MHSFLQILKVDETEEIGLENELYQRVIKFLRELFSFEELDKRILKVIGEFNSEKSELLAEKDFFKLVKEEFLALIPDRILIPGHSNLLYAMLLTDGNIIVYSTLVNYYNLLILGFPRLF
jgi:hypothetical protein